MYHPYISSEQSQVSFKSKLSRLSPLSLFKNLLTWFKSLLIRYHGSPEKLKKAVSKAERLHTENGKRYRVFFLAGRYRAMNRRDVQQRKRDGDWKRHVNMTNMEPLEFYDTENGYSPEGRKVMIKQGS
jgi:ribosomal 50S subunit-associated protein YjgA (DUF615 family)